MLAIAEAGDTVTADHLLQMACLAAEHKPTVLGIPGQVPIPNQLEDVFIRRMITLYNPKRARSMRLVLAFNE